METTIQHDLCEGCGESFRKKRRNQKFCAGNCRSRAFRRKRVMVNILDLSPDLRHRIAEELAGKKRSKLP